MGKSQEVNPDLLKERRKCTFDTQELTHLLDGGADKTEERKSRGLTLSVLLFSLII